MIDRFLCAAFLLLFVSAGQAQDLHSSSKVAVRLYKEGVSAYTYADLDKAETCFLRAVGIDDHFFEAYMMLGELYERQKKYERAAENYMTAIQIDSTVYKPAFFRLAESFFYSNHYERAAEYYKMYMAMDNISEKNRKTAGKNLKNSEFAISAMQHPVDFFPENISDSINTAADEYWPSITADGEMFMFTRQKMTYMIPGNRSFFQEDLYVSRFADGKWQVAENAGASLNTLGNEGAQTLSSGGNYMFFTACDRKNSYGSCDIYFSAFNRGQWMVPVNVGPPVNTKYWESTPSVNADGNMLFFSSNRPGGVGGKDLWYSVKDDKGSWTKPVNLGRAVNTEDDELSPFIHFDGVSLYFSSNGHSGMGGFDLYMTTMNEDSTWSEPKNLGYPINTSSDEMGLVINSKGDRAFFSSLRNGKQKGKDIFTFELDAAIRPHPVSYIKGKVTDKDTGRALASDYELINLSLNKTVLKGNTDESGNFLICLPSGYNYGLHIVKPGYLFFSENFLFEGEYTVNEPLIKNVHLHTVKVGEKLLLRNVFYEFDSWKLKSESMSELDILVKLLEQNKGVTVEIDGYTDSVGTDVYNIALSEKRAGSVAEYLISKGIAAERLMCKGYGNAKPIGDNKTEEGQSLNRRTEVKIISID